MKKVFHCLFVWNGSETTGPISKIRSGFGAYARIMRTRSIYEKYEL